MARCVLPSAPFDAEARSTASARERAGYFCFGKSNQNHPLLTRAAATRRYPALAGKGTSPERTSPHPCGEPAPLRRRLRRSKSFQTICRCASLRSNSGRLFAPDWLRCSARFKSLEDQERTSEATTTATANSNGEACRLRRSAISYHSVASAAPPSTRSARPPRPSAAPASPCRGRTRTAGSPTDRSGRGSRNPCAASGRTR